MNKRQRASVERAIEVLDKAVELMNHGGKHWVKWEMKRKLPDGSYAYCSLGGISAAAGRATAARNIAENALQDVLRDTPCPPEVVGKPGCYCYDCVRQRANPNPTWTNIPALNDYSGTTWKDVKAAFIKARRRLQKDLKEVS